MKKSILLSLALLIVEIAVTQAQNLSFKDANDRTSDDVRQTLSNVDKQFFIENKGQWPSEVLYLTQMNGLNAWVTIKGMWYEFYKTEEIKSMTVKTDPFPSKFETKQYKRWGQRVGYTLKGNNTVIKTQGIKKQEAYYNYLIGNDSSKHASNVGLYKEVLVKDVYVGIDIRYYFEKGNLRYDYIVRPGADPNQIQFNFEGSDKIYLNEKQELVFTTCFGEVKNAELYSYQINNKKEIASRFIKKENAWAIALDAYDKSQTLIIDPLVYSTYIGGINYDFSYSITVDHLNNSYITGTTDSPDYDTAPGAFQSTKSGLEDAFISKLNAAGSALIYSTFIGGSAQDRATFILLDNLSNIYITGYSGSTDYYITPGAFQTSHAGNFDVFVTKLNPAGNALIYSTFIGGSAIDRPFSMALDSSNNAYITGHTSSIDYDVTAGAYQGSLAGVLDAYVTKLNSSGTAIIYSTYIGGSDYDEAESIALDPFNNVYITGYTKSTNYDLTPGAFQTSKSGTEDIFVTKLNTTGTALIYSTYLGGNGVDRGYSIAVDDSSNTYIAGYTNSSDYDITAGSFQPAFGGNYDVFVTKLNSTGNALVYSSYIGGSNEDGALGIAIDNYANVYITGYTYSSDYDITPGAFQTTHLFSDDDVFVTKLNSTGNALVYSTYLGGVANDAAYAIALDSLNNIYVTGFTYSTDYDITSGAYQTAGGGTKYDSFVSKLCLNPTIILSSTPASTNQILCVNTPIINITYNSFDAVGFSSSGFPAGVTANRSGNVITISGLPSVSGTFNYSVSLTNNCGSSTTITGTITVKSLPIVSSNNPQVCPGGNATLTATLTADYCQPTYSTGTALGDYISSVLLSTLSNTTVGASTPYYTLYPNTGSTTTTLTAGGVYTITLIAGSYNINDLSAWIDYNQNGILNDATEKLGETDDLGAAPASTTFTFTVPLTAKNGITRLRVREMDHFTTNDMDPCALQSDYGEIEDYSITIIGGIPSAISYSWSPSIYLSSTIGSITTANNVSASTIYTITATGGNGCTSSGTSSLSVNVPTISVTSNNTIMCIGETANLTATGAASYTWNTTATTSVIVVSPSVTTSYSVDGVDVNGCANSSVYTQSVSTCTEINENNAVQNLVGVYPNPNNGAFTIELQESSKVSIVNTLGQEMINTTLPPGITPIKLNISASGIYFVKIISGEKQTIKRVIIY